MFDEEACSIKPREKGFKTYVFSGGNFRLVDWYDRPTCKKNGKGHEGSGG